MSTPWDSIMMSPSKPPTKKCEVSNRESASTDARLSATKRSLAEAARARARHSEFLNEEAVIHRLNIAGEDTESIARKAALRTLWASLTKLYEDKLSVHVDGLSMPLAVEGKTKRPIACIADIKSEIKNGKVIQKVTDLQVASRHLDRIGAIIRSMVLVGPIKPKKTNHAASIDAERDNITDRFARRS